MTKVKAYADLNFSKTTHRHDGDYYTESEIDTKVDALTTLINGKANASHNQPSNTINLPLFSIFNFSILIICVFN